MRCRNVTSGNSFEADPENDPRTMATYVDYYDKYAQLGPISSEDMRRYYVANLACRFRSVIVLHGWPSKESRNS